MITKLIVAYLIGIPLVIAFAYRADAKDIRRSTGLPRTQLIIMVGVQAIMWPVGLALVVLTWIVYGIMQLPWHRIASWLGAKSE